MARLTKLEKEILRRAAEFALAGEWPWEDGGPAGGKWSPEHQERERRRLQRAADKLAPGNQGE